MENPDKMKQPEALGGSKLEDIKARLAAIKTAVIQTHEQWESEKTALAKEIVDMAEGNKALAEATTKSEEPRFNSANARRQQEASDAFYRAKANLTKFDEDCKATRAEIKSLLDDVEAQEKGASGDAREQFAQLLMDAARQLGTFELASMAEREKMVAQIKDLEEKNNSVNKNVQQSWKEQAEAAKNPPIFATETVLAAHKEFAGKDYTSKKSEIEAAVNSEAYIRDAIKNATAELPKIEEYITSIEKEFDSSEQTLKETSQKMNEDFNSIAQDLNTRIQPMVRTQEEIITAGENPGFWAKMGNAEHKANTAKASLRSLKAEQSQRIEKAMRAFNEPLVDLYYKLSHSGPFSHETFQNNFPAYKLDQWTALSEKNPQLFGEMTEKIQSLHERGKNIGPRREKILAEEQTLRNDTAKKYQQLLNKIDELFASV